MTTHKKHEDTEHVQIRTKILNQYGNPIEGAIEYDPKTGYGKRIKLGAEKQGIIEPFYQKDGSIEIDGHNFDDTNHETDKVDAIRDLVNMQVNRGQPGYDELLQEHVNNRRRDKQGLAQRQTLATEIPKTAEDNAKAFVATQNLKKGMKLRVNLTTGEVEADPDQLLTRPDDQTRQRERDRGIIE